MKPSIKILVCYHKKFPLLKDEILTPIHLGRARANQESEVGQWLWANMIGDDTGENISDKNSYYNEMTAYYWAWKNYDALGNPDYVGLAHYRRHFVLEENVEKTYSIRYYDEDKITDVLNYSPEKMYEIVDGCDFVTHLGRVYNNYEHYVDNQRKDDIDTALEILKEKFPEYAKTADDYMAGQVSNFYNMNIFSRELFFQYCEFVFSIMEEFENRMPSVLNRRMFISERITAIFMKKLMDDEKYKFKYLPVAFIEEPLEVNLAMYISNGNISSAAVTVQSILKYANAYNKYVFYLIQDGSVNRKQWESLKGMIEKRERCGVKIVNFNGSENSVPVLLSFLLPKLNKCLYLTKTAVILSDIAEFYRLCVVDDYYAAGVPSVIYNQREEHKTIAENCIMLNCKRIRSSGDFVYYDELLEDTDGMTVFNQKWGDEINYIAHYWYVSERLRGMSTYVFDGYKSREQLQIEARWCPIMLYDELDPMLNAQGIYTKYWWDTWKELPVELKQISRDSKLLRTIWKQQLDEIWLKANYGKTEHPGMLSGVAEVKSYAEENKIVMEQREEEPLLPDKPEEDWRNYGFWGKLRFYYRHNGAKQTVNYAFQKMFNGKEKKHNE